MAGPRKNRPEFSDLEDEIFAGGLSEEDPPSDTEPFSDSDDSGDVKGKVLPEEANEDSDADFDQYNWKEKAMLQGLNHPGLGGPDDEDNDEEEENGDTEDEDDDDDDNDDDDGDDNGDNGDDGGSDDDGSNSDEDATLPPKKRRRIGY
ncbi:hypothetical protein BS78_K136400 [Paspalum vaginatum]|uniref:Uncharacterized protein n=1 Tax=Paspalum vaginatum TaxID=158149 RepID=A0A9W8CF72_9POAL|nr:hypothetical protein BS78_K136400 [Paspalum vaginatum]